MRLRAGAFAIREPRKKESMTESPYETTARCHLIIERGECALSRDLLVRGLSVARSGEARAALVLAAILAGTAAAGRSGRRG